MDLMGNATRCHNPTASTVWTSDLTTWQEPNTSEVDPALRTAWAGLKVEAAPF